MLYADLKLPGYIDKFEGIVKEVIRSRYYREIILIKLWCHHSMRQLSWKERQSIENIIANIVVKEKHLPKGHKSKIIGEFQTYPGSSRLD